MIQLINLYKTFNSVESLGNVLRLFNLGVSQATVAVIRKEATARLINDKMLTDENLKLAVNNKLREQQLFLLKQFLMSPIVLTITAIIVAITA